MSGKVLQIFQAIFYYVGCHVWRVTCYHFVCNTCNVCNALCTCVKCHCQVSWQCYELEWTRCRHQRWRSCYTVKHLDSRWILKNIEWGIVILSELIVIFLHSIKSHFPNTQCCQYFCFSAYCLGMRIFNSDFIFYH